jgi:hypothetical protein
MQSAEMNAMEDLNPFGPKEMSKHRQGELNGLLSPEFQKDQERNLQDYQLLHVD